MVNNYVIDWNIVVRNEFIGGDNYGVIFGNCVLFNYLAVVELLIY